MPTNRRLKVRGALIVGPIEREHFLTGPDHLLALGGAYRCWICDRGIAAARAAWQAHRESLLAEWRFPFFPMFGQVIYDKAKMPARDPAWSWLERATYATIVEAL